MPKLRPFQSDMAGAAQHEFDTHPLPYNVMAVLPTGAGKTVLFAFMMLMERGASCAVAHRSELVGQMSMALARNGVRHRIIGPDALIRQIVSQHMNELGRSYYDPTALAAVAGIDTLIRMDPSDPWFVSVRLVVMDEAHHVLAANKWGRGVEMFPNARGLFVTATPIRTDGKGLGRTTDGLADAMIVGPGMRDVIRMGYLTDYKAFAPASTLDLTNVPIGSGGDYQQEKLRGAVHQSSIVGDIVEHYMKRAFGKLGVTFAVDIEHAHEIAAKFNACCVPAEVVSSETPFLERVQTLARFRRRELLQLVNVDLFGEGFDLPAIEVVSMGRPTQSFSLFCQQFGRALRLMIGANLAAMWDTFTDDERRAHIAASDKPFAIILDHVGNIQRHGLPDSPQHWTLDRRDKRAKRTADDVIPTRTCANVECEGSYERVLACCPYCGRVPVPALRTGPEHTDGDLLELTPEVLAHMRGEIAAIDGPAPAYSSDIVGLSIRKRHHERQVAQTALRADIALWSGHQKHLGRSDGEIMKRFYFAFGTDIGTAQTLGAGEAEKLRTAIADKLIRENVIAA